MSNLYCPFCNHPYPADIVGEIGSVEADCPSQCDGAALLTITCPNCNTVAYTNEHIGYLARGLAGTKNFQQLEFELRQRGRKIDLNSQKWFCEGGILVLDDIPFIANTPEGRNSLAIYLEDWDSVDLSALNLDQLRMLLNSKAADSIREFAVLKILNQNWGYNAWLSIFESLGESKDPLVLKTIAFIYEQNVDKNAENIYVSRNRKFNERDYYPIPCLEYVEDFTLRHNPEFLLEYHGKDSKFFKFHRLDARIKFGYDGQRIIENALNALILTPSRDVNEDVAKEILDRWEQQIVLLSKDKFPWYDNIQFMPANPNLQNWAIFWEPKEYPRIEKGVKILESMLEKDKSTRGGYYSKTSLRNINLALKIIRDIF